MCRKQPGIAIGRLCDKCDGKCPVCDSYVRPTTLVRICDECSFGNYQNKCVVCGGEVSLSPLPSLLILGERTTTGANDAVGNRGSRTLSTASSVRGWRRIGMGVRRLSTWGVRGRICFTRRRILGIIDEVVFDGLRLEIRLAWLRKSWAKQARALPIDYEGWTGQGYAKE